MIWSATIACFLRSFSIGEYVQNDDELRVSADVHPEEI